MLTITSRENPQIKQVCGLLSAAKKRRKEGLFVCEGFTLLEEALRRGLQPKAVYCLESQAHRLPKLDCPCALVNQSVLEKLSDVPAPQGVVFTLPLPEAEKTLTGSRFLALDSLRDPGNMGTILRTADSWGLVGSFNEWGGSADIPMTLSTEDGMDYLVATATWDAGVEFKVRANSDWAINYGDAGAGNGTVTADGANLKIEEAGEYEVRYYFCAQEPYITVTKR